MRVPIGVPSLQDASNINQNAYPQKEWAVVNDETEPRPGVCWHTEAISHRYMTKIDGRRSAKSYSK
ncbi:MAG TPA: hypothetical protein VH796_18395 [Nitrososphaeraceae archaeon]